MEWLPITVSLCHRDCSYHQELTQAPISQHPLTPIMANGLPDEARGVIPALMINNIKMRTLSILQSFRYKRSPSLWPSKGSSTNHSAPAIRSARLPGISLCKWMEPIEETIHSRVMDSKHKLLFTLPLTRPHYQFTPNRMNLSARMQRWRGGKKQWPSSDFCLLPLSLFISYWVKVATPQKTFHFCWLIVIRLWRTCHVSAVPILLKQSAVVD